MIVDGTHYNPDCNCEGCSRITKNNMIEKLDKPSTTINSIDQIVDKLNELVATVKEIEKKIDFIMENSRITRYKTVSISPEGVGSGGGRGYSGDTEIGGAGGGYAYPETLTLKELYNTNCLGYCHKAKDGESFTCACPCCK